MIAELGHFLLVLSLVVVAIQSILPLVGIRLRSQPLLLVAQPAAVTAFALTAVAFLILVWAFVSNDFSLAYVANNSNTELPLQYRMSAVWGAHEGSLLLWVVIHGGWMATVALFSRHIPLATRSAILAVMAMVMAGFLLFLLFTSNPFERLLPPAIHGRDLNPLLQDPGLIVHPPMLYMGYVGFVVAFAFAVVGLMEGKLDANWARWVRPWTNTAWLFLTIGIALGSWWAYYELGWGGWWFWDPVENASFMPWLVATALMHSLAVTEYRGLFKAWTVLLAIVTFSLSLLGMFLVRSGVLTSVHAFANDPARGVFLLFLLLLAIGSSLILYSIRAHTLTATTQFHPLSRETFMLINNLLLVVAAASILLGTLYPLVFDALGWGKLSVGSPYFNTVLIPMATPLVFLLGIGSFARWKKEHLSTLFKGLWLPFVCSISVGIAIPFAFDFWSGYAFLGGWMATWILFSGFANLRARLKIAHSRLPLSFVAMLLGHGGMAIFILGVTFASVYSVEKNASLAPGEHIKMKNFSFQFAGIREYSEHNYHVQEGIFTVRKGNLVITVPPPQKRWYPVQQQLMTEAGISSGVFYDLYISLGELVDKQQGRWSMRIYYRSFVNWIWFGAVIMALAALLELFDKRYRKTS